MKKLYVGNIPYETSEDNLTGLFKPYGTIEKIRLMQDCLGDRSSSFAFIEMSTGADIAAQSLNGSTLDGRTIEVTPARTSVPRR